MTLFALSFAELSPLLSTLALPLIIIISGITTVLFIFAITMTIVRSILRKKAAAAIGAAVVGKMAAKKKSKKQQAKEPATEEPATEEPATEEPAAEEPTETPEQ